MTHSIMYRQELLVIINTAAFTKSELLDETSNLFVHQKYTQDDLCVIEETPCIIDKFWQTCLGEQDASPRRCGHRFPKCQARLLKFWKRAGGLWQEVERAVDGVGLCLRYMTVSNVWTP
ncbi:uncharacterized protein PADG_03304 [Paracoccidioides brasiliensis Pb18]|uniref:Uncharacterized protein n=1 Tax=Paracoccidioides brasiliensis (strain Pb18) TaxID=502780 RepID=C1G7Z9_PARBD|nr:uncharacterized protein PADG_03304 [Paracoccidioides brasiliensis Pb18]EEH47206.2 hypothetical protein PADG_03304 [Paracoccidioides brasiliensis Pb18]